MNPTGKTQAPDLKAENARLRAALELVRPALREAPFSVRAAVEQALTED
jgi:hypothetical protein